jgi:hypothetical protein
MLGFRQFRRLAIGATAALVLSSGGAASAAPKLTTGITVQINGKSFTYSSDGADEQYKDRGFIVQGSTLPDTYKFTIPRTATTGLDKLAWKTAIQCAGIGKAKGVASVDGFVDASAERATGLSAGKISLRAG